MNLTQEQIMAAKGQGFLPQKDKEHFAARVIIPAGHMSSDHAKKIIEVATRYGRGYFTLTQRLDVEIPWITYDTIEAVKKDLAESDLYVGGTGLRIRPIHTCKGNVCRVGLYNTEEVALAMHERFYKAYYDTKFPSKLRIGLSGCPNSCSKPQLTCIGLVGKKLGQVSIFIGGMFGRDKIIGQELKGIYTPEEALDIIERGIQFHLHHSQPGERFAKTVQRLGFETVEAAMLDNTSSHV
ncbi:MAG: hypothetical protein ACRCW2_15120 [Cellulosilyticaceae bacterium]